VRRVLAAVALLATIALVVTACGSDEDEEAAESAAAPAGSAEASTAAGGTTASEPLPPSTAPETPVDPSSEVITEPGGASITVPPPDTPAGPTELAIAVWEGGRQDGPKQEYTLTCDPPGGTLPEPERACVELAAGAIDFEPVPADAVCTMIYGGPAVATVTGTAYGKPIDAEFSRENGCQAERWDGAKSLLPADLTSWAEDEGLLGSTSGEG
jgi:hypothetical protein